MAGTRRVENADLTGGYLTELAESIDTESSFIHCDVDQSCDWAKYVVFVGGSNLFEGGRKLFFCGHHFRENEAAFNDRKYGVKAL